MLPDRAASPTTLYASRTGDRILLYTDGLIESENSKSESFGERGLEEVIHKHQSASPSGLVDQLLSEIRLWQAAADEQQDDITVVVIDVI